MTLLLLFLLSIDSFFASFILGALRIERVRQIKLALAFGVCDGVASQVRTVLERQSNGVSWLASRQFHLILAAYLGAVFVVWLLEKTRALGSPLLWTVPIALSLDNLVGPGAAPSALGSVALVALASGSMSLAGFGLAAFLSRIARNTGERAFAWRVNP